MLISIDMESQLGSEKFDPSSGEVDQEDFEGIGIVSRLPLRSASKKDVSFWRPARTNRGHRTFR